MLKRLRTCPRADFLALGAIILFFFVFFARAIFGNEYLMAGDSLFYNLPMRTVAWRMIRSGHLPLWTPEILSGYPLLSMAQLGLGYPLTWFYLFLPPHIAEKIFVLSPFLLAPVFTYAYLRKLGRSPFASLLGSLTFGYGGMMASPLANSGLVTNGVMWLPLLLLTLEQSRRSRFIPTLLAATFSYSLAVLNGHAQSFIAVGVLFGAYSLWLTVANDVRDHSRWRPVLVALGAGLLTLGIAAFQILETGRVVRRSVRRTLSYELFTQGSFAPDEVWRSFTTPVFYVIDMSAYVPPLAAALASFGVYAHLRRLNGERDARVFFWFLVAVIGCVLMMGKFTPVYQLLYYIPVLNLFRVPSRHTIEWTFAAAVLGAYGWDAMAAMVRRFRSSRARAHLTTTYPALLLIAVALVIGIMWWSKAQTLQLRTPGWPHPPTIYRLWKAGFVLPLLGALWRASLVVNQRLRSGLTALALLVLCFVEPSLLIKRWWTHLGRPASEVQYQTDATRYLLQFPPSENRIYTRVNLMSEQEGNPPRFDSPNLSAMWGLQNVAGYEPLILERYSRALGGAWLDGVHTLDLGPPDPSLFRSESHVLDILNTRFVIAYPGLATSLGDAPLDHSEAWQTVYDAHETVIMRNNNALPRAWLVNQAQAVTDEVALAQIRGTAPGFDPRRTALLEVRPEELPLLQEGPLSSNSTASITVYEPRRIVIESKAPSPTVLVVSEIFFPGWEATIDGQDTRIMVTDYLLRGVSLPAGEHTIEMRYTAPAFRNGSIISLSTIGVLTGLFIYDRRRHSRKGSHPK